MKTTIITLSLLASFGGVLGCAAPVETPDEPQADIAQTLTLAEFKESLDKEPGLYGLYRVDGDLRMTEAQVDTFYRTYVARPIAGEQDLEAPESAGADERVGEGRSALVAKQKPVAPTCVPGMVPGPFGALIPGLICTPAFADDVWGASRTNLTFCISNAFAGNKRAAARALQVAAKAWEQVAGVRFVYLPGEDAHCDPFNTNVQFEVTPDPLTTVVPGPVSYGGFATYPSVAREFRQVHLTPQIFDATPSISGAERSRRVVTHELGHMLGFAHEHVRVSQSGAPVACSWDAPAAWRALTSYDSASIMHYPGCNGSVAASGINVTAKDGQGASSVYGAPLVSPHACAHGVLTTGVALDPLCLPAVAEVCAVDSFCCTNSWDSLCIDGLNL